MGMVHSRGSLSVILNGYLVDYIPKATFDRLFGRSMKAAIPSISKND